MLWGIFLVFAIVILFLPFFEQWRLYILTDEASKKVTATLTSLGSSHLYDSYSPVRDSTSGAVTFDGEAFTEIRDTEGFFSLFIQLHKDTQRRDNSLLRLQGEKPPIYEISDIRVFIHNADSGEPRSKYRVEYTLKIPQQFLWKGSTVTLTGQTQTTQYLDKY